MASSVRGTQASKRGASTSSDELFALLVNVVSLFAVALGSYVLNIYGTSDAGKVMNKNYWTKGNFTSVLMNVTKTLCSP